MLRDSTAFTPTTPRAKRRSATNILRISDLRRDLAELNQFFNGEAHDFDDGADFLATPIACLKAQFVE